MKGTARIISTYTGDVMGVCSALYELGGMSVMHDASGCNSTYNTHDEPRWYDTDSLVFLSGLTEMEALMGNDEKLIGDVVKAAEEFSPKFIAIAGTPIPMITGFDYNAVAKIIEKRTGIITMGIDTNSMHTYIEGVSKAFSFLSDRFVTDDIKKTKNISCNILGLTPLDFSINGAAESIKEAVKRAEIEIVSSWAMGDNLDNIKKAGSAGVNLVVSYSGMETAKKLKEKYGTPFVVGVPIGEKFKDKVIKAVNEAFETGKDIILTNSRSESSDVTIIGESIISGSIAEALKDEYSINAKVVCPLETDRNILSSIDDIGRDEDEIIPLIKTSRVIIADPLYKPIFPEKVQFVSLPQEAFSGRIYRNDIPNMVKKFSKTGEEVKKCLRKY